MPFNPAQELDRLEESIANSKKEDVEGHETFQARAALKYKGWDQFLCEEAIARGFKRQDGIEVGEAPWRELGEIQADEEAAKFVTKAHADDAELFLEKGIKGLREASKVSGDPPPEADEGEPTGLPPVRYNLLDKESQEQEEVREEGPEKPVDDYWDCPNCASVNKLEEDVCPRCRLDKSIIENKILELVGSINTALFTKDEHVRFLNDITILRRKNKRWANFLTEYMKKNNLKPTDMEGLIGPRPWKDDPLYYDSEEEEIPEEETKMDAEALTLQGEQTETPSDKDLMKSMMGAHFEEKEKKLATIRDHIKETLEASSSTECPKCDTGMLIVGEPTGSWVCPECGWNVGYPEGEGPSLKFLQENKPEEVERDPIPALDRRKEVIVSEESGWLCLDCNRVWPHDFEDCPTCKLGAKAAGASHPGVEDGPEAHVHGTDDDCELCKAEATTEEKDADFVEKARLMMQLKAKEKGEEDDTTRDTDG